jgi:hypothetical protein
MSEPNKTLLRHYVGEVWHKRNLGASEELMSPESLDHADKEVYAARRASGASTRHTTKRPPPTPTM